MQDFCSCGVDDVVSRKAKRRTRGVESDTSGFANRQQSEPPGHTSQKQPSSFIIAAATELFIFLLAKHYVVFIKSPPRSKSKAEIQEEVPTTSTRAVKSTMCVMCRVTRSVPAVSSFADKFEPGALGVQAPAANNNHKEQTKHDNNASLSGRIRILAHHEYHDHANEVPSAVNVVYAAAASTVGSTSFPMKLYDMLEKTEQEGLSHIVSWQPHGRAFVVRKPGDFRLLLPQYFKLTKLASFQRQLNLYGFKRLTRGDDRNG